MAETREEVLSRNAHRFAKYYYDNDAMKGAPMVPEERKAFERGEDAYIDWMARAMYEKMAGSDEYSEENWDESKADRLDSFKDKEGASYAIGGGKSPEQVDYEKGWDKFKPLVENDRWTKMSPRDIAISANSDKMGYDMGNEQSRKKFWDDLQRYANDYNKAKIADEFANSGWGKANAVLNRTAYKEAMEQALGDKPYDVGAVLTGYGIDRARDAMMAPAMALGGVIKPALAMGAADAASQFMGAAGLGQKDYSPEETLSSVGAGATVLPGFRYATRWISRLKNPEASRIGKELYRGARNYSERDYVTEEANALKQELLAVRKEQQAIRDGQLVAGTPKHDAAMERLNEMEDKLRLLGYSGRNFTGSNFNKYLDEMSSNSFNNTATGRFYSIDQMLGRGQSPIPYESAARALESAVGDQFTFNVSRPTLEEAATRLAGRNLGYTSRDMDYYGLAKMLRDEHGIEPWFGKGMESAVENEAQKLIENGEAANYLDQVLRNASERRAALKSTFPAMSKKLSGEDAPKGRTAASVAGSGISNALGLLSGSEGVDLVAAARAAGNVGSDRSVFQDKIDTFKNSDWYKKLPEDRKNTLEYAFKKAAEERKKKK